ncbi:NUDIX hydrolase [Streptomyces specialis]|uniref:NUDIX hydrolase n=1 Tax=Streptomyces specialis TaxID=498367 RepID=UPI00073F1F85|nr:NUDIX hydrolase [Streptomyces specialis]
MASSPVPPTVIVGQALVAHPTGALLLVRPAGADFFRLPGGVVPHGVGDGEATVAAVRGQTGLAVRLQRLVAKDFVRPPRPGAPAEIHLVHNAGQVRETALRPNAGGPEARWVPREELGSWCEPALAARVRAAVLAALTGTFAELDTGCPMRRGPVPEQQDCPACLNSLSHGAPTAQAERPCAATR